MVSKKDPNNIKNKNMTLTMMLLGVARSWSPARDVDLFGAPRNGAQKEEKPGDKPKDPMREVHCHHPRSLAPYLAPSVDNSSC